MEETIDLNLVRKAIMDCIVAYKVLSLKELREKVARLTVVPDKILVMEVHNLLDQHKLQLTTDRRLKLENNNAS